MLSSPHSLFFFFGFKKINEKSPKKLSTVFLIDAKLPKKCWAKHGVVGKSLDEFVAKGEGVQWLFVPTAAKFFLCGNDLKEHRPSSPCMFFAVQRTSSTSGTLAKLVLVLVCVSGRTFSRWRIVAKFVASFWAALGMRR